jgi:hypothetical protein
MRRLLPLVLTIGVGSVLGGCTVVRDRPADRSYGYSERYSAPPSGYYTADRGYPYRYRYDRRAYRY